MFASAMGPSLPVVVNHSVPPTLPPQSPNNNNNAEPTAAEAAAAALVDFQQLPSILDMRLHEWIQKLTNASGGAFPNGISPKQMETLAHAQWAAAIRAGRNNVRPSWRGSNHLSALLSNEVRAGRLIRLQKACYIGCDPRNHAQRVHNNARSIGRSLDASCSLCRNPLTLEQHIALKCKSCGVHVHADCAYNQRRVPVALVSGTKQWFDNWHCLNCKRCNVCGGSDKKEGLLCRNCDSMEHVRCQRTFDMDLSYRFWTCSLCVKVNNNVPCSIPFASLIHPHPHLQSIVDPIGLAPSTTSAGGASTVVVVPSASSLTMPTTLENHNGSLAAGLLSPILDYKPNSTFEDNALRAQHHQHHPQRILPPQLFQSSLAQHAPLYQLNQFLARTPFVHSPQSITDESAAAATAVVVEASRKFLGLPARPASSSGDGDGGRGGESPVVVVDDDDSSSSPTSLTTTSTPEKYEKRPRALRLPPSFSADTIAAIRSMTASSTAGGSSVVQTSSTDERDPFAGVQAVKRWSTNQVAVFFHDLGHAESAEAFKREEIDGAALLLMERGDVFSRLGLKMGPALKTYKAVRRLQKTFNRIRAANNKTVQ